MARKRLTELQRKLHFVDNSTRDSVGDKAWTIQKVVQVLQRKFRSAWHLVSSFLFDECVLPSTSRRNTTRTYIPD